MRRSDAKLSIALVFDDSLDSTDGVSQYVKTVGAWLTSQGYDVSYLVGQTELKEWSGGPVYSMSRNIRVVFNGNRLSIPLPANKKGIETLIGSKNFDVIHVMMPHSPFMAQRVINLANDKTAVIGTFHVYPAGSLAKIGGRLLRLWYGRKVNRFDQIVSVSSAAAEYASGVFGFKTEVIPNPVNVSRFQTRTNIDQGKNIVFLGRLVPRKGCALLLQAFSQMKDRSAKLTIAGSGPQKERLKTQALKLGISNRVRFLGFLPEDKKPELLAGARIACFPSLYGESFGIVLVEAMASGSGVVLAGDNPGYRSVLKERPEVLINPNDTDAFASRLDTLLSESLASQKIHQWQLETAMSYDINRIGAQLIDVYHQQIARRTKKGNN